MGVELPAIPVLKRYLEERGLSITAFAIQNGMDKAELSKLLRGARQRVSVEQAAAIQDATHGTVYWRLWIPVRDKR